MNYFALAVIVLQFAASASYCYHGKNADAAIWCLYGLINLVLVFRERLQ